MNDDLLTSFNEDINHAKRLLVLLDEEFEALKNRQLERLQSILAEKQPLLTLLNQHADSRSQLLASHNLSTDRLGIQTYASQIGHSDALMHAADQLAELLVQCQSGNVRNGRLIRANQTSSTSLLGILRGGEPTSLYDSRGSKARIQQHRPLSQA
jgi:flagella synthesis protein FlgN